MAQRWHHYERAFEAYLRAHRIPYIAVDEARKTLLPEGVRLRLPDGPRGPGATLKSFDFVIYGEERNLLADVKGRRIPRGSSAGGGRGRLDSWVTKEDVESLVRWEELFGENFKGAFIFIYWCENQPPDALFQEVFEDHGRWYAIRAARASDYVAHMRVRSPRWGTVHVPSAEFERISGPFLASVGP